LDRELAGNLPLVDDDDEEDIDDADFDAEETGDLE